MSEKKSIIFVVPRMSKGGAEKVLSMLGNQLVKEGIHVGFAFTIEHTVSYKLNDDIEIIVNHRKNSALGQIGFIRNLMKKRKNTIFVSFFTYQNIYALAAGLLLKNKIVVSERNDPRVSVYNSKFVGLLRKILYPTSYGVVFQTEQARNYFSSRIKKKSCIIHNPISSNLPDIYNGGREKRIVAVSRINKQKNIPMMIRGIKTFLKSNPEYVLEIYGESGERNGDIIDELKTIRDRNDLSSQIRFMGFESDVVNCIRKASLYVNTSNYEGISNSMLEALALGLPCVCTDCPVGGAQLFIKEGINGYLVPVGDESAFADKVKLAIDNGNLNKTCIESANNIRHSLDIKTIVKEWCDYIKL